MSSFWVVVLIMMSVSMGAMGTWLVMSFKRGEVKLDADPDQLDTIRKLHELETYLEARGEYYEQVAKSRGMPRKDRYPSYAAWRRLGYGK